MQSEGIMKVWIFFHTTIDEGDQLIAVFGHKPSLEECRQAAIEAKWGESTDPKRDWLVIEEEVR